MLAQAGVCSRTSRHELRVLRPLCAPLHCVCRAVHLGTSMQALQALANNWTLPQLPQLPVELPRFYSLAVLLGDPVALLLVDLLWSLNVAKKRERDSMTVLVGFCQSNVNSAIALWIVFAIRFTRKDILNIAFVVCQWALGSTFCLAYIATQQCAALISNLPHIDQ